MERVPMATPHHLEIASSYFEGAERLLAPDANPNLQVPGYHLLAHGAELTLKAALGLRGESNESMMNYRHNLRAAHDKLTSLDANLTRCIERHVSKNWREYLRAAREKHIAPFLEFGLTDSDCIKAFDVPSNADIGERKPKFSADLEWLSHRHASQGGQFRYLNIRVDVHTRIKAFGLNEPTVPKSILWGCRFLLEHLEKDLRQLQNAPPCGGAFALGVCAEAQGTFSPALR